MRTPRLGRDITAALLLKLFLLTAIYLAFFRADAQPPLDAAAVTQQLFGAHGAVIGEENGR
jgi:hypothetical protein